VTLLLNRELESRAKLFVVSVLPDIVKDCPKIRNLPKIFLSFENVAPDLHVHASVLLDVTCRMGSHSVTCHPTQVNSIHPTLARKAGTRLTYTEGWKADGRKEPLIKFLFSAKYRKRSWRGIENDTGHLWIWRKLLTECPERCYTGV